jgi:hypothetical protein
MKSLDAKARAALEEQIRAIEGVLHASIDPGSGDIWVVRDPQHEAGPLDLAIQHRLTSGGHNPAQLAVRITVPTPGGDRRRVRFVSTERSDGPTGVTITVRLEWNDVLHLGAATGERGAAVELKTTAQAAVMAIEALCGYSIGVRIVGIKQVHAFDSDIIVASLLKTDGPPQRLVGAVIVSNSPIDSAALAVLSGLNRTLGNFLHTTD